MSKTFLMTVLFLVSSLAVAATTSENIMPNKVYTPMGFDSNDNSEIVLSGNLPNLCFKSPTAKFTVDQKNINIEFQATYLQPQDQECTKISVPYLETLSVGVLDKGTYDVTVNGQSFTQLKIVEATSSAVDDFIYANIDYVEENDANRELTLVGNNPSDCVELDQVKVIQNANKTLTVLPILKQVAEVCNQVMVPFEYKISVPRMTGVKAILIHVRKMDGRSINKLYRNY